MATRTNALGIRSSWKQLEPQTTGWAAHAAPFAFEPGPIRYANNIARFTHGSPAIPTLYAAQSGYRIINAIGVANIRTSTSPDFGTGRTVSSDLRTADGSPVF